MSDIYQIDKARVRASFDRAASSYDGAAILQREVRERMLKRLELIKLTPKVILDAGCGTGHASLALGKRYRDSQIISLDIAMGMLQQTLAHFPLIKRVLAPITGQKRPAVLCADIEKLPLQDSSVDLIWSNVAIQWCNDLDIAFSGMARVLRPEGLLMFSTFGPDTLKELRAASSDGHIHVSRFIDMHDIGDALVRAGFADPVLDVERFVLTYDDVMAVMRDLKAIGANNAAAGRARGLLGRGFLDRLTEAYEQFRQEGKLPATYEVIYGHAWKAQLKQPGVSPVTLHRKRLV